MDDLKQFAKDDNVLEGLLQTVKKFNDEEKREVSRNNISRA